MKCWGCQELVVEVSAAPPLQIDKTLAAQCNREQIYAKVTSAQEHVMVYWSDCCYTRTL